MSWLYSRALVEEYSAGTCSDGVPYAQLNVMPTPHAFWRNDKMMGCSQLSRFGQTCAVLTEDRGAELLMSFLAASRARTSARPERAQASTENAPASGVKWRELSARYDRDTSSWKTHQRLFQEDLAWSSVTFPKWGMTADGVLWERLTPALRMSESARGSRDWIPTPTTPNGGRVNTPDEVMNKGRRADGTKRQVGLESWVRFWLTPTATDAKPITGGNLYQTKTGTVRHMRPDGRTSNRGLAAQVLWPTPTASTGGAEPAGATGRKLVTEVGGALNPTWVEWLMGWPLGWTDLKPLETDKFRQWRRSHGAS